MWFVDQRLLFRNMHSIPRDKRRPASPIIQFYSSKSNIGNYLPVAAIQQLIGTPTDTWCIHERVDFDYVNTNYATAIIGGAGLLHRAFEGFWRDFASECRIPTIIWGIGMCLPDGKSWRDSAVARGVFRAVADRAELINVRDDLTRDYYELTTAHISPCPTIAYLSDWKARPQEQTVTLSTHPALGSEAEHDALDVAIRRQGHRILRTNNVQGRLHGLRRIIRTKYVPSSVVVSSRLHGAIIAYGLGIPYIILARDEKVRAFRRLWHNGLVIEDVRDIDQALTEISSIDLAPIAMAPVQRFTRQALEILTAYGHLEAPI